MSKVIKRWQGLHAHRYTNNPLEEKFAEAWQKENDESGRVAGTLRWLLGDGVAPAGTVTPRTELVANTVIQWLGTPVGQCFLRDLGFVQKDNKDE